MDGWMDEEIPCYFQRLDGWVGFQRNKRKKKGEWKRENKRWQADSTEKKNTKKKKQKN